MANKSTLRTEVGERVEQSDFQYASQDSQRHLIESVMQDFVAGDSASGGGQPSNFIIDGFSTTAVGTVVTVAGGKMIVGMREAGVVEFGMLLSSGATSRNRDLNGLADATYGIYVRAEFHDDRFLNRLFWNALAPSPTETPKSIPTRRAEDWNIVVELVSPGPEWQLVATAAKAGAVLTLVDKRVFLFDTNDGTVADSIWGGGNDRNANRPSFGVKSLYRCLKAIQKQLIGIIGGTTWMASAVTGTSSGSNGPRSLTQLNDEKLARNGAQSFQGLLAPDVDLTHDFGTAIKQWAVGYFGNLVFGSNISGVGAGNQQISFSGAAAVANRALISNEPNVAAGGTAALVTVKAGASGQGTVFLDGTSNALAKSCEGQNGLAHFANVTYNIPGNDLSPEEIKAYAAVVVPAIGGDITAADAVIGWSDNDAFPNNGGGAVDWDGLAMARSPKITANNTITIFMKNVDNGAAQPAGGLTVHFNFVILRR